MDRFVVLVDAGYVWVQFVHLFHGSENLGRDSIAVDISKMSTSLERKLKEIFPEKELLRIYWYDGLIQSNPSQFNQKLSMVDGFKLRYGTVNKVGQQKGVDGLIIADLLSLSQYRAVSDALLISGDGDLAPGVAAAQAMGIKVLRLEIGSSSATSPVLQSEVDKNIVWDDADVLQFISHPDDELFADQADAKLIEEVVQNYVETLSSEQCSVVCSANRIDPEIDKSLLYHVKMGIDRWLTEEEKKFVREKFKEFCHFGIKQNLNPLKTTLEAEALSPLSHEEDIAQGFLRQLSEEDKRSIRQAENSVPREIDRRMLNYGKVKLGRDLTASERKEIRELLTKAV